MPTSPEIPDDAVATIDSLPIPATSIELLHWAPIDSGRYSRNELKRQRGKYPSTLTASIAAWSASVPNELGADVEDATREVVDFDGYLLRRLGPGHPTIGPMSAILLRTESASSSQIENLTTSAKQLALAEISEGGTANARVVIGNVRAMEAALRLSDQIDIETILQMHRELLTNQRGYERYAGVIREEPVWIGRDNAGPIGADFVAPTHQHIAAALTDLLAFIERADLPILIQVAVAHAQFETIHPFVDGNGRTGRALAHAMLRNKALVRHATIPISAGLLADPSAYFRALTEFRGGDAAPIARQFAAAARLASASGRALVDDLSEQLERSRELLTGLRSNALAWKVLPRLIAQPVINSHYLKTEFAMSDMSAKRTLDVLASRGVLVERTGGARHRVWQHRGILEVLDNYGDMVRRGRLS